MKNYFCKRISKSTLLVFSFFSLISVNDSFLNAEYLFNDLEMDTSTKAEENSSVLPSNPFEIVEMIRRHNSMNDSTNPSDAIDDALRSFNSLEEK